MMPQTKIWLTSYQKWSWWRWWINTRTSSTFLEFAPRMVCLWPVTGTAVVGIPWFNDVFLLANTSCNTPCFATQTIETTSWTFYLMSITAIVKFGVSNMVVPKLLAKTQWNQSKACSPPCPQVLCMCWWSMPPKGVWGNTYGHGDPQAWTTLLTWPRCLKSSSPSKTCFPVPTRLPEGWSTLHLKGWVQIAFRNQSLQTWHDLSTAHFKGQI